MRHVISLSTIPPRFSQLGPALTSLVRQTSRPEAVELYIPRHYRRFPQWGGGLPDVPEGVTIVRVDEDLGPATKVLPAARAWRGQGVELLYVDDDQHFSPRWAGRVLQLRRGHPTAALCAVGVTLQEMGRPANPMVTQPRAEPAPNYPYQLGYQLRRLVAEVFPTKPNGPALRQPYHKMVRSGYTDIAAGFGGVALRPEFFDDLAYRIPPVLWTVDDVWLSGHLARKGVPIWADRSLNLARAHIETTNTESLFRATIEGAGRDEANQACIDYMRQTYGIWGGVADQST